MLKIINLLLLVLLTELSYAQIGKIPAGFTPIFNGKNLTSWHTSRTSHQGTTGNFYVENGVVTLKQYPYGQGGVLLTNKKYGNFELYLEAKVDSFCTVASSCALPKVAWRIRSNWQRPAAWVIYWANA